MKRTYVWLLTAITSIAAYAQTPEGNPAPFPTRALSPQKTHIRLTDLPEPYHTQSNVKPPKDIPRPADAAFQVPEGFSVNMFSERLDSARWMAVAPNGDIFVVQSRKNRITVLRDSNKDGAADQVFTFAEGKEQGLDQPMGIDFRDGYLYVANTSGIVRFRYRNGQTRLSAPAEPFITGFTPGGYHQHWTRNILFHRDRLFVSIGSETNVDPEDPPRATIQSYSLDGKKAETYASGLRNPVGLAVNPVTGQLWTTNNERDWLGDDLVPDFMTSVTPGGFYGWPYFYLSSEFPDPRRPEKRPDLAEKTITPDVLFQAHSVPLGIVFYTARQFPAEYHRDAFVAMRGSSNRLEGTGYKIVRVRFDEQGKTDGSYEDFMTGWLAEPMTPAAWGRPVGLVLAPDGSLLIADETGGVIWRVSYTGR
jgi:glucose/arabinose dehydrogenase